MRKFGRSYYLSVETQSGDTLAIEPPFTIEFDITRNTLSSANVCSIRIYNLSAKHRNQILHNRYDTFTYRQVQLKAGYGLNLPVIFQGNITQAWSVREGSDYITAIECFDGGFGIANGMTNQAYPATTTQLSIIESLIAGGLPHTAAGTIGETYTGVLKRGASFSGNTMSLLKDIAGNGVFIDGEKVHALGDNECLLGPIETIDSSSGLLGTPVREESMLTFDMIFEPRVASGQIVYLNSSTAAAGVNNYYKVVSIKHKGLISGAVCGDAVTTLGMFVGTSLLTSVGPS